MGDIVDELAEIAGKEARFITRLESTGYELLHVRDELQEAYTREELDSAHRNLIANQVSLSDFRSVLNLGEIEAHQFFFEDVIVFLFPASRYQGLFVSYDREEPFPASKVIEAGTDALE
jgi:hypothetical protein